MSSSIIIGVDGNEANIRKRVGVGQYAYQVLTHLYKCQMSNVKCQIYLKNPPLDDLPKETNNWRYKVIGPDILWTQFALPLRLWEEKLFKQLPDLFFTPSHYAPRFSPCPSIISIMDLSFIHFPEMFLKKDLWQLKNWTAYSVKNATKIFTISDFSKKSIVSYYGIDPKTVVVTYPGYDDKKFNPPAGGQNAKVKSNKYILFVGTLQPRKNIARLIEAFKMAMKQLRSETMKLTIVGKKGWLYEEIFRKVNELDLGKNVIFTDYVSSEDLPDLYRGAECLVLPSLYEGFGLPVLEAMACGCPVVVSNVSALPEIVGSAAVLVNPYSTESIAQGIYQVCYDKARRLELIKKGLLQVKKFSWRRCAKETLATLIEVYDKNKRPDG